MDVSIIMPFYNASAYINETVNSIISQTFKKWELIIVNDFSNEPQALDCLTSIAELDTRIKVIHLSSNQGAGKARNVGIEQASGRYLAFCDSDDWWYPTKLEEQINFMQSNGYEFSCTYYEDANSNLDVYYTLKQKEKQSYKDLLSGCNIGTPGVIYDTSRIGKKYMPELRRAEDWGYWLTLLKDIDFIYTYPKPLWKYRHLPNSETSNKFKQLHAVQVMYTSVLKYSYFKSWCVTLLYFLPLNILKKIKKAF